MLIYSWSCNSSYSSLLSLSSSSFFLMLFNGFLLYFWDSFKINTSFKIFEPNLKLCTKSILSNIYLKRDLKKTKSMISLSSKVSIYAKYCSNCSGRSTHRSWIDISSLYSFTYSLWSFNFNARYSPLESFISIRNFIFHGKYPFNQYIRTYPKLNSSSFVVISFSLWPLFWNKIRSSNKPAISRYCF